MIQNLIQGQGHVLHRDLLHVAMLLLQIQGQIQDRHQGELDQDRHQGELDQDRLPVVQTE
mgnify:CR=1 FL=1